MQTIKINRNLISKEVRTLEIDTVTVNSIDNENILKCLVKTKGLHGLATGSVVTLNLDEGVEYPIAYETKVTVVSGELFEMGLPIFSPIRVYSDASTLTLVGENEYIYKYVKKPRMGVVLRYKEVIYDAYRGVFCDEDGEPTNEEDAQAQQLMLRSPLPFIGEEIIEVFNDWYYENGEFNPNIFITDDITSIKLQLCMESPNSFKLNDEQGTLNTYFNDVKKSIIPDIIDREKRQFSPIIKTKKSINSEVSIEVPKKVNEIEFNLHFRDRTKNDGTLSDNWETSDEQYWFNLYPEDDGVVDAEGRKLKYAYNYPDDSYADELDLLGFTEDDIKYSKEKIKRSFLRLLFYSDDKIMSKNLLFYSTVFLDAGRLQQTYAIIKNKGLSVFDKARTDKKTRLSASFSVKDKFNTTTSSEGFYLYLFPDEISVENLPRTIYMTVEFNHGGKGETLRMMLPRDNDGNVIEAQSGDFPLNMMSSEDGTDYSKYNRSTKIPVEIEYNHELQSYVYNFPFVKEDSDKIVLNLFEPRGAGVRK